MGADAEEPESKAGEAKSPKTKAEDNPWYLLATLFGVAERKGIGWRGTVISLQTWSTKRGRD
jgi:hypothetical protein